MASGTPASPGPFAERLDHLFRTVLHTPADGRPPREYTHAEVAKAINEAAGRELIAANYLQYLRVGRRGSTGRTSRDKVRAIADFFGVPPTYFDDDQLAVEIDAQPDIIAALRNTGIRAIATHAVGLPPHILDAILTMTAEARRIAGLPQIQPQTPPDQAAQLTTTSSRPQHIVDKI